VLGLPGEHIVIAGSFAADPGVPSVNLTELGGADAMRRPLHWLERAGAIAASAPTFSTPDAS
jgi:hypothetical protein